MQVSSTVLVAAIVCATLIILGVVGGLVAIDIIKDGSSEAIIIGALVGLPTLIITSAGPLLGHILGASAVNRANEHPAP